jgi:transcription elongation GreA/GreB family factor
MDKLDYKKRIWQAGVQKQEQLIDDFVARINEIRESEESMGETQFDSQHASQQGSNDELIDAITGQLNFAQDEMRILRGLEPSYLHEKIQNGTVVITDSYRFYTCVSLEEFLLDDEKFFGVSTKSPIYDAMCDLKAGDQFEVNGNTYSIKEVF